MGIDLVSDHAALRLGLEGVLVGAVYRGGGADEAGMRPTYRNRNGQRVLGDLIVAIEGQPVRSSG